MNVLKAVLTSVLIVTLLLKLTLIWINVNTELQLTIAFTTVCSKCSLIEEFRVKGINRIIAIQDWPVPIMFKSIKPQPRSLSKTFSVPYCNSPKTLLQSYCGCALYHCLFIQELYTSASNHVFKKTLSVPMAKNSLKPLSDFVFTPITGDRLTAAQTPGLNRVKFISWSNHSDYLQRWSGTKKKKSLVASAAIVWFSHKIKFHLNCPATHNRLLFIAIWPFCINMKTYIQAHHGYSYKHIMVILYLLYDNIHMAA